MLPSMQMKTKTSIPNLCKNTMLGAQAKYTLILGHRLSETRSKNTGQITYCKDNVIHRTKAYITKNMENME